MNAEQVNRYVERVTRGDGGRVCSCGRKAGKKSPKCSRCATKEWRDRNEMRAAYANKRSNARRDGVGFELTLEEFSRFCVETDYLSKRGGGADDYVIGRKDHWLPYRVDNIKLITRRENSKEGKTGKRPDFKSPDIPF